MKESSEVLSKVRDSVLTHSIDGFVQMIHDQILQGEVETKNMQDIDELKAFLSGRIETDDRDEESTLQVWGGERVQ